MRSRRGTAGSAAALAQVPSRPASRPRPEARGIAPSSSSRRCGGRRSRSGPRMTGRSSSTGRAGLKLRRWCAMRSINPRSAWVWTRGLSPSSWGTGAMGGSRSSPCRTSGTGMRTGGSAGCCSSHRSAWTGTRGGGWYRGSWARRSSRRRPARRSACWRPSRSPIRCSAGTGGRGGVWTSATPVVLPRYDSLRGRLRPERSVRKLLRHAGIAEALVERAAFARGSRLRGSTHPLSYRRPGHLARYPCMHLSVEWTVPVRGPLALGAGVGYGLGLLVPVGEEFLGSSRGDVEGN